MRPRCCSLDALLPCLIFLSLRRSPSKALMAALTKAALARTQLPNGCEFLQAEKERKELETQFKALYRDKYVPLKEAHKAGKTVTTMGPFLNC